MAQPLVTNRKSFLLQIIPVMLCFFVMGFVDLVGTASNYVQKDLSLTDAQANLFPSLVFFWFLIFSVPTGMLMNRIGRKRTVLISHPLAHLPRLRRQLHGDAALIFFTRHRQCHHANLAQSIGHQSDPQR